MKCPYCQNPDTKVIDSRSSESNDATRRRRECLICSQRFTTYERVEEISLVVIKKDGGREIFNPSKLLNGLMRACEKRNTSIEKLNNIVADIENELRNQFKYEVPSSKIGEMTLKRLRDIDKVAYVRFASVYRHFENLDQFNQELEKLQESFKEETDQPCNGTGD